MFLSVLSTRAKTNMLSLRGMLFIERVCFTPGKAWLIVGRPTSIKVPVSTKCRNGNHHRNVVYTLTSEFRVFNVKILNNFTAILRAVRKSKLSFPSNDFAGGILRYDWPGCKHLANENEWIKQTPVIVGTSIFHEIFSEIRLQLLQNDKSTTTENV